MLFHIIMIKADSKSVSLALILLLLLPGMISAEGQGEEKKDEGTPISIGQPEEVTIQGVLEIQNSNLIITDEEGNSYFINSGQMPSGAPSVGMGRGSKGQGGRSRQERRPPSLSQEMLDYAGSDALVKGMILVAPEGNSPFGDVDGVLFPKTVIIDGAEVFF